MNVQKLKTFGQKAVLFFTLLHFAFSVFSQEKDSTKHALNFRGSVSVTNNGFSLVPTFSLGEPAVATFLNINGIYVAGALTLARQNFPFSISGMMNKAIDSDIPAKDFDWNVSLNYTFGRNYAEK